MSESIAGKFLLEILTQGMYSNPLHVYREYIQNAVDSIDSAIGSGMLDKEEAEIHIDINEANATISIRDNGCGVSEADVVSKLMNIGLSKKVGIQERGFRGIGRIAGLTYADEVLFITSALDESIKTVMKFDCIRLQELLRRSNTETESIMETFEEITQIEASFEDPQRHYFEVRMRGVKSDSGLLFEDRVVNYLSETAPVDFDSQKFLMAREIREYFENAGYPLTCYTIKRQKRKKGILKLYSSTITTGRQTRTRGKDGVRRIEFITQEASDGKPLYIGWLAVTDFSGAVADDSIRGIRFRKGNILVGDSTTFERFFPSEGSVANKMFVGEIHVLHEEILPNSQRDDFEPGLMYQEMAQHLSDWAKVINKRYRRGTSEANSALRDLAEQTRKQKDLEEKIQLGVITSGKAREECLTEIAKIEASREKSKNKVEKARAVGIYDDGQLLTIEQILQKNDKAEKTTQRIKKEIVNADYSTKNDLPSSYSRSERRVYERIITVIDAFFGEDQEIREALREEIKKELSVRKK